MSAREERLARNEAISRAINEGIEQSHNKAEREGLVRMVCECGFEDCERLLAITVREYEDLRDSSRRFAVLPEHVIPEVEEVVGETDRYVVVEKRGETGELVADRSNPRG